MNENEDNNGLLKDIDKIKDNENIIINENNEKNIDSDMDDNIENGNNIWTKKNNIIKIWLNQI